MSEVSIIVPIYNRESTLEECVNSIISQDFVDFELLLVDDGSTDNSLDICKRYEKKDKRIKVYSKDNGGPASARNYGIRKATGKFLAFVDSDDYIPKEYITYMISSINEYGNTVQPVSYIQQFNENELIKLPIKQKEVKQIAGNEFLKLYNDNLLNSTVNKLYDNEVVQKNNILFHEDLWLGEDLLFNIDYLRRGDISRFVILNHNIYYYRKGDWNSLSSRYHKEFYECHVRLYEALLELAEQKNVPEEDYKNLWKRYDWFWQGVLDYTMRKDNPQPFWKKVYTNSKIMKTKQYKAYLERNSDKFGTITLHVYKSHSYFLVWLVQRLIMIREKIQK